MPRLCIIVTMTLQNQDKHQDQGLPIAAIAYYGPTNETATKVVVAIISADKSILESKKWTTSEEDIRFTQTVSKELAVYIANHRVSKVVIADGILGCPHEAGIDYPEGEQCPYCPYWATQEK